MPKTPRRHYDIVEYASWMGEQVAELNVLQYGGTAAEKRKEFGRVTDHPFAKGKGVAICALDGQAVVGVQTYRYWPYDRGGQTFYSLQSGGTLVHPEHRGQGLFMRMLTAGNEILIQKGVDFLTGFPVPMSFGGFIKDGWCHVDSPRWFLRPVRPLRVLTERLGTTGPQPTNTAPESGWPGLHGLGRMGGRRTNLSSSREFLEYRYGESRSDQYDLRHYVQRGRRALVVGKYRSSNGFSEYVVGDVLTSDESAASTRWALTRLLSDLRSESQTAMCSMLVGNGALEHLAVATSLGFFPTHRTGIFIAKAVSPTGANWLSKRWAWNLLHADIDTW
ncbi:MAG: GNAT family N-acetyltransferase [Myxococcales bacterium]|nr:GNAT family N-acetyltransferase [Myxococcales bacterium]